MKPKVYSLAAALTLSLSLSAHAGLQLVQVFSKMDSSKTAKTNKIFVDKDRVRIETGTNPDQFFIYRSDKKIFWAVNLKDKTYLEMTEKDFEEMFAKMDDARKKMQASMANMPPAQKEMMEKMMAKMMPAEASKTTFKKIGGGGKINGWNTDKYEGIQDGAKHSDIWTATPKSLDVSPADFQVMQDMAKFFEKFTKNMEGFVGGSSKNGLDGIPVRTIVYKDGKAEFQSEMKEVKKESLAASLFEVPAGFQKKEMGKAK